MSTSHDAVETLDELAAEQGIPADLSLERRSLIVECEPAAEVEALIHTAIFATGSDVDEIVVLRPGSDDQETRQIFREEIEGVRERMADQGLLGPNS